MVIFASLSGCTQRVNTSTTPNSKTPAPIDAKLSPTPSVAQLDEKNLTRIKSLLLQNAPTSKSSNKSVNILLYTSDTQCQKLIPKRVAVPSVESVTSAVGKILKQHDSGDFSVSGYRVTVKNGTAIVDLRISPHSQRQFTSLSNCEQFALFGSLRKTLTSNAQWKIKQVRFTELGKEMTF